MMLTLLTFIFSTALALVHAATTDDACVRACGSYSTVLGYCDGLYGARAAETNYTYANAFVGCLCEGHEMTLLLGNGSALADYGICESCASTPHVIVADLSAVNGSAANATLFMPVAYTDDGADLSQYESCASRAARVGGVAAVLAVAVTSLGLASLT